MTNEAENFNPALRLQWLKLIVDIGQNADYANWIEPLEKDWDGKTLYDTLLLTHIKQAANLPVDLESLKTKMQKTLLGNYYFGESNQNRWNRKKHFENNLLAYNIFSKEGDLNISTGLKRYILRQKSQQYWFNTYLTAKVVHNLLLEDFDKDGKINRTAILSVNDTLLRTFSDTLFQINPISNHPINFKKSGKTPLYLTAYQEYWNPEPHPRQDIFSIQTQLFQDNKEIDVVEANKKVQLKTTVKLDAKAEYTVVEIPIPASCSYGDSAASRNWWSRKNRLKYETHREYFKDRVAIYCRQLPPGTHTFSVDLEPGYTGTYTMNPATVEMMYFPTFNGRNGSKRVEVVEQ